MIQHRVANDDLLGQAERFLWACDYLEARARARLARDELPEGAEALSRVALVLRRSDTLVEAWQAQNEARGAAHAARERAAIGAGKPEPADGVTWWRAAVAAQRTREVPSRG